ncbi:MAG: PAS domain-containing protein [Nitrospinae bacterium]|nr:PAS domain-containing protein [Nitrospinota bacterium]
MPAVSGHLFKRVYVPMTYTLPIIMAILALSCGYIAIEFLDYMLGHGSALPLQSINEVMRVIKVLKVITVMFVIAGAVLGILMSRAINQAIEEIIASHGQIKEGAPVRPVQVQASGNELERLSDSFNRTVNQLNNYILDSLMGCTIILDQNLNVLSMNAAARKTLHIPDAAEIHEGLAELLGKGGENREFIELMRVSLLEGMVSSSREVPFTPAGGDMVTLGLTASVLRNARKEPVGLFVIFKDLTRIKEVQKQMQRTEKMVSLGRLSASIAHEIRNPLGSIKGLTQLLMERAPEDEKVQRYTGVMIREIERLNGVVQNLLNFANPTDHAFERCDVKDIVREVVALASYKKAENRPRIDEEYDTTAPAIMAEREKLFQALLNIVINALEAAGKDDAVQIRTKFRAESFQFRDMDDHDGVVIEISNTGSTIDPDTMEKIFDPFFTTKSEGSGLGLAITQQIISLHNGNLKVRSKDNLTTFIIELPISAQYV